jgi:hypothetical protein
MCSLRTVARLMSRMSAGVSLNLLNYSAGEIIISHLSISINFPLAPSKMTSLLPSFAQQPGLIHERLIPHTLPGY